MSYSPVFRALFSRIVDAWQFDEDDFDYLPLDFGQPLQVAPPVEKPEPKRPIAKPKIRSLTKLSSFPVFTAEKQSKGDGNEGSSAINYENAQFFMRTAWDGLINKDDDLRQLFSEVRITPPAENSVGFKKTPTSKMDMDDVSLSLAAVDAEPPLETSNSLFHALVSQLYPIIPSADYTFYLLRQKTLSVLSSNRELFDYPAPYLSDTTQRRSLVGTARMFTDPDFYIGKMRNNSCYAGDREIAAFAICFGVDIGLFRGCSNGAEMFKCKGMPRGELWIAERGGEEGIYSAVRLKKGGRIWNRVAMGEVKPYGLFGAMYV